MPLPIDNLNVAPYYDTTQQEIEKGYHKYLAIEGQVLQNRELNVAQGLIQGNVRKITDLIIDDASVVSGCNFINNSELKMCYLEEGEIYFNGLLVKVEAEEWTYEQVPESLAYVCAEISQMIYTESDDPALYDPAENIENTGNRGGHRVKFHAVPAIKSVSEYESEAVENKNLIAILKIKNRNTYGPLKPKPIFSKVYNQMAERTYDSSGDFIANGLKVYALESDYPEYKYNVKVSKGRAYVKGYNYTYDKDIYMLQDVALETRSCGSGYSLPPETKTFLANTYSYTLNKNYIKEVKEVSANFKVFNVSVSSVNDVIFVNESWSLKAVTKVYQGETTYTNYTLNVAENKLIWDGAKPSGTYYVDIIIERNIYENVDYYITRDGVSTLINLIESEGMEFAVNEVFSVSYTWYLSRYDLVYMKEDGMLAVKNGLSDEITLIKEPKIPAGTLPLAYIKVEPGKTPRYYNIQSFDIYRVPMAQLQTMKRKINDIEYNFAMTELENIAQNKHLEQEDLYSLKNIFVDGVVSYDKADIYNGTFDATIDLFKSEVRLPMNIEQVDWRNLYSSSALDPVPTEGLMQLDTIDSVVADFQPYITHNIDIAPHYFKGLIPKVVCDPKKLSHIKDTETSKVIWLPNRVIYSTKTVNSWRTINTTVTSSTARSSSITTVDSYSSKTSDVVGTEVVETKKNEINLTPNPFIQPGSVLKIAGTDFPADSEILLYLDDKLITTEFTDPVYLVVTEIDENTLEFTDGVFTWRPWCWRWRKHWWNGGWHWRLWHPYYTDNKHISFYYDENTEVWLWEKFGFGATTNGTLSTIPTWLKWIRRSPWIFKSYIPTLSGDQKTLVENINTKETITGVEYPDNYEEANITVVTDQDGRFEIEIKIPENIPVGKHTITAETVMPENFNPDRYFMAQDEFTGESYTRHWENEIYMRKIERVVETIYVNRTTVNTTVIKPTTNRTRKDDGAKDGGSDGGAGDPVAQSFMLREDQFLNGLDLYFSHKSNNDNAKAWINIREMENGFPTGPVIYYQELDSSIINVPSAVTPFPVTHIDFDYPVYVEAEKEYAFTVGCNVDGFRIFYAKMGNRDLVTNEPVIYQPHPSGVMYTSSNNRTWTPIQDSDLTYVLYRAEFDIDTEKVFRIEHVNSTTSNFASKFSLMNISVSDVVLEDTDIKYEYTISTLAPGSFIPESADWKLLNIEELYELETTESNMYMYIKITLSSTDSKVTPTVNIKTFSGFFANYKTLGSYVLIPMSIE